MDQLSILLSPEERMYDAVRGALEKTLYSNGLDASYLSLEQRKTYHSVLFDKTSVIVRISNKPTPALSVPTAILLSTPDFCSMVNDKNCDYTKIKIPPSESIEKYTYMLQSVLQGIIDRIPKEYDCCSQYLACSDALSCVHSDKKFALKCGYRKILKSGKVFFGINRNVD